MKNVQQAVLDAIDKMHDLMTDRTNIDKEEVKTDIAIANATFQLAKAYVASVAIDFKIKNTTDNNRIMLEETL